jgi:signal transduction histidine kinase
MRFFSYFCILPVFLLGLLGSASAAVLQAQTLSMSQLAGLAVLEDASGTLTIDDVSRSDIAGQFQVWAPDRGQINVGFTRSAYWVRVALQRASDAPSNWVIELPFFQLNTVDFYAPGAKAVKTGGSRPIATRPFLHRFYAFPVEVSTEPRMYYLRVTSNHSLTVPLTLWQEQPFRHQIQNTFILQALYFGGLFALLIYNLFLAVSLRDLRFLLYTLFVGNFALGMLAGNGLGQMYLWPGRGEFDGIAGTFFLCLAGSFSMLFADRFLQTARYLPWASRGFQACALIYLVNALALVTAPWHGLPLPGIVIFIFLVTLPAGALVVGTGIQVRRLGHRRVRFFLLAWLILWLGAITATLRAFELLPTNTFTSYSLQISSAFEMLLLALALADVVHLERQERESAQREALQANQRLLESARTSEERLEREVKKRTVALERALDTETRLLEKYLRFGALISHEFRNPLGIVNSQISLLRKEHQMGQLNLEKRLDTMASATRRLLSLFETWLIGDRLQHAMQDFEPQHIPLAAWLRGLVDAQTAYHDSHPLELRITRAVSDVWADEGLLEVALVNLIDNACKYSRAGQPVLIETRQKSGWIGIAVTDQGCGIDKSNHTAVFEDYRRVSPESTISGMGLGLAFVRRIVDRHQGELELKSALGEGSSFCLWLPHK